MHHRTAKNGQWNPIYIKYSALIMILLLKMVSESNNDRSGVFYKGFLQEMFGFLPKTHLRIRNTDNTRQQLYFLQKINVYK